jgi:hypothetical protein
MIGQEGDMRILLPVILLAAAAPAAAAERSFSVTDFNRIRVEGPYRVTLETNRAPFARASGSAAALDKLSLQVQGRTLIIRQNPTGWGGFPGQDSGPVEIRIGGHELAGASVSGSGSLSIDRVRGLKFSLSVNGAGSADIAAADVDQLGLVLQGTGTAKVGGKALKLNAIVYGASLLDTSALNAKEAVIGASGPASVTVSASETAKVTAKGVATVALHGRPACTNRLEGTATVSGCR